MIFDPPTRSRRRALGRYLWPIIVVTVVVVAVVVASSGEETRSELEYLEELRSQASELSRDGDILRGVIARLDRIDRTELITAADRITENLAAGLAFVVAEPPTRDLFAVRALYRLALTTWDRGLRGYVEGLLTAADEPDSIVAADFIANALAEIRAGDRFYRDLVEELERSDTPDTLVPLPSVVLMPADADLASLANSHVFRARSPGNRLALRPSLMVSQIVAQPAWEVNPSGQAVLPATTTVRFSVVITNAGNVASEIETVILSLTGGPEELSEEALIDPLEPNQQATIEFEEIEVAPGGVYQVVATLMVIGPDLDTEDNQIAVQFSVNEE